MEFRTTDLYVTKAKNTLKFEGHVYSKIKPNWKNAYCNDMLYNTVVSQKRGILLQITKINLHKIYSYIRK